MTGPPRVLIRKEPDGQLVITKSHPEIYAKTFDVAEMARAIGSHDANKAYLELMNFVLGKEFSVLLQYPDGQTYYAWVTALDAEGAVEAAKNDWRESATDPDGELPDFEVLLVVKGHVDAELRKEDV